MSTLNMIGEIVLILLLAGLYLWVTFSEYLWWVPFLLWIVVALRTETYAYVLVPFASWAAAGVLAASWFALKVGWLKWKRWRSLGLPDRLEGEQGLTTW